MSKAIAQKEIKQYLKAENYKKVKNLNLYINSNGTVFNFQTGNYLKPNKRNAIQFESKFYYVSKLVLQAFAGEPYRNGQIAYLDGNKRNNSVDNIKYIRLFDSEQITEVNPERLKTAIRCYFEIDENFKTNYQLFKNIYLQGILDNRSYTFNRIFNTFDLKILKSYVYDLKSITKTAKTNDLSVRDCNIIINRCLNILINEILDELQKGQRTLKPFNPKPKTNRERTKEINKRLQESGITERLPLRKESLKEVLKNYTKHSNKIYAQEQTAPEQ